VTVLDFGAAKFFGDTVGTGGTGVVIGTPLYMAPETARVGIADARSDLYAVGVIMFEMLTGQVPFDGPDEVSIMVRHVRDPVPSPREVCPAAEITQDAERVVMKALAKDPEARHQSMLELHADLQRCYGLIKFRRSLHVLPPGMTAAELRKPVPLTNVKKKEKKGEAPLPASSARPPVHATPGPLLLTKRRSGRHRTLPFTPAVSESTPAPSGPARPPAPGAPARPPGKPPGRG
jgi:serine/threonine protein kinase